MTIPTGAIDVHVHAGPSFFDRKFDAIELAQEISESPMAGAVLKSHFATTDVHAEMANKRVSDVVMYPATVLNSFVGGFNPVAVEYGLERGSRVVWLPTFSADHFDVGGTGRDFPFSNQKLTVFDDDGELKQEVREVLETLADADREVTLGNGHISPDETYAVFDAMDEMGLDIPYLITHADFEFMQLSQDDQEALADRGAYIGKCFLSSRDLSVRNMAASIEDIGPDRCVITTDHGQDHNPSPVNAFDTFIEGLRDSGISDSAIETMAVSNPRHLIGETST